MPNYVNSYVRFERMNDAAKEKFFLLKQRISQESNFSDLMQDGTIPVDEIDTRAWQHENIGPKWTTIDDTDDTSIALTSAWVEPSLGVNWLISELASVDPELITAFSYSEEQPDFAGYYVYLGEEIVDGYEDDYDDIKCLLEESVEGLSDMKDGDDYTEEGFDLFHENVWEVIENHGAKFIDETIQAIYDEDNATDVTLI